MSNLLDAPTKKLHDLYIETIYVEELFNLYTYDLNIDSNELFINDYKNLLLILYGDNGSGKTTILELVFYLLSYSDRQGHKSEVARTQFKKLRIEFANNITVSAIREESRVGSFTLIIKQNKEIKYDVELNVDVDNSIKVDTLENPEKLTQALEYLKSLNLNLYFLTDDRQLQRSTFEEEANDEWEEDLYYKRSIRRKRNLENLHKHRERQIINSALKRVNDWIRTKALNASDVGEENTNTIYTDIIQSIASPHDSIDDDKEPKLDINEIQSLSKKIKDYSKYGLISSINFEEILKLYQNTTPEKQKIIFRVLEPYINGIKSRLSALENIKEIIDKFIKGINYFLRDKSIYFSIKQGLRIKTKKRETLAPRNLSSGEKQLLLLFCNTVTARDQASIFIIDEPEISLNIKWQRKLIEYILDIARGAQVQFIMATHSIELISNYNESIAKLEPLND